MHTSSSTYFKKVKKDIDRVSPSFCLAKWQQVTIHLQTGLTHSCHHPEPHKIELSELRENNSALHNTNIKKLARKEMLEGTRPKECSYCWQIEDAKKDNISDRAIKSAEEWSYPHLKHISSLPWDANVNPTYAEVSFGHECNFKCAYCAPNVSSSILNEVHKYGTYTSLPDFSIEAMKRNGTYPIPLDQVNPYVEAFWNWWPSLQKDLAIFRITGGEPLLNSNTFKFLNQIIQNPLPALELAINSNLGIPDTTFRKFLDLIKIITEKRLIKKFVLYTSVDSHGKHAEFVRFGMNYSNFLKNVNLFLQEIPNCDLVIMCTYNLFSVVNFKLLLDDLAILKNNYRNEHDGPRVILDIPYLNSPEFFSCKVLPHRFKAFIKRDIDHLKQIAANPGGKIIYYPYEIAKLERIYYWFITLQENEHTIMLRKLFSKFISEYCERKKIQHTDYVPEYKDFIEMCSLY
jgi:organic radical activating enzyme